MNAHAAVHPTDRTLRSFALGKLDDASSESVTKHLEQCPDCRKRVAEMSADSFLERVRGAQACPDSPVPLISSTAGLSMLASGSPSSAPPATSSLPPGLADHPDYQILCELGQGGMGVVYLAQNKLMGRKEVLKVVGSHLINRRSVLDRFLGEIRHAAQLHHSNVVTAYSVLRIGESLVLAMEYVEGLDLAQMVKARGPLPVAHACNYIHQAASGLQHAHEQGMVHRDIKPSNLMLTRQGNRAMIKVLDFGLAKVKSEGMVEGGLTHEGQMLGTPEYVAPEQTIDARNADIRADIYSLGCTLYYLLTGAPPFQANSLYELLQAHHSMDAMPLNLARPEVPVELAALVARMMAKEPERRLQTPAEVGKALMPFFKKGTAASVGSKPDLSQVGQPQPKTATPGARSVSAQPSTRKAPVHLPKDSAGTPRHDPVWASLVELEETESGSPPTGPASDARRQRPQWFWPAIAAAAGFAAVLLGIIIHITIEKGRVTVDVRSSEATGKTAGGTGGLPTSVPKGRDRPLVNEPSVASADAAASGFVSLFNGRDLRGWKSHPIQPGNWHVANGVLIGSGPALSHLYTERGDFTDFHLRVEARFNEGGSSGVYLRCPFGPSMPTSDDPKWPDGFEATINNARIVRESTGGLYPGVGDDVFTADFNKFTSVPFGQWFTLEVIAEGNALAVLVNGESSAYKFPSPRLHPSGHIALQQYSPETVIEFRKIEIKELDRSNQKDSKEVGRFLGITDRVQRVAFSPDGLGILSGGFPSKFTIRTDGSVWFSGPPYVLRLWEVASGRNLFTMEGQGVGVAGFALSSDGRYAASSEWLVSVIPILIWDLKTGLRIHALSGKDTINEKQCIAMSFSPDDRRVMAAVTTGTVLVWDLATEQEQPPITLEAGPIKQGEFLGAAFTSDRQHLVTAHRTGLVELWDLQSGKKLQTFAGHTGEVRRVACSVDGRLILSGGSDNTIRLWDVASGKELKQLKSDERQVRCVAFSPDSRRALSAGVYGPVHLWDLASGKEVCRMEGHTMRVNAVAFSPDGRRAVSGSDDRTVRLWQLPELVGASGIPSNTAETPTRGPGTSDKVPGGVPSTTSRTSPTVPAMVDGVREGVLLPTGEMDSPSQWLYTTVDPGAEWASPQFDTREWTSGLPAFGHAPPNIRIRTPWETPAIWLRTSVVVPRLSSSHVLLLRLWNDDGVDIYVNGKLLIQRRYEGSDYGEIFLDSSQRALFHEGKNTLAVCCVNIPGTDQVIDVGLRLLAEESLAAPPTDDGIAIASNAILPLNGRNFEGWSGFLGKEVLHPSEVFRIEGRELVWAGHAGRISTDLAFRNFSIKFDYLLPLNGRIRSTLGDLKLALGDPYEIRPAKFPVGMVRCALNDGDGRKTGDILLQPREGGNFILAERTANASRPANDWNEVEIRCQGRRIRFILNGQQVNSVEGNRDLLCQVGFNSRDTDIRFRNILIVPFARQNGSAKVPVNATSEPSSPGQAVGGQILPLNGRNFEGWSGFFRKEVIQPSQVFRIEGDELVWARHAGRIFFNDALRDFSLKFQYLLPLNGRYGTTYCRLRLAEGDPYQLDQAGYRVGEVGCALTNGQEGRTGDIVPSPYDPADPARFVVQRSADSSRPAGEWNEVEIRCQGRRISFFLNGQQVNSVEANRDLLCQVGFNSWDADIRFRKIRIVQANVPF
jgi:serine/threonine protein kinase/WD40 repeat protein